MAEDKKYFDVVNELRRVKPYADIDGLKWFNSIQEGLEATRGLRLEGKSFYVIEEGKRVEYIFEGGIEDSNLKKVEVSASGEVNIGSISTTDSAEQLALKPDGLYFANGSGVYNISISNPTTGVSVANGKTTVDSGYLVSFLKKNGSWSVSVVEHFPNLNSTSDYSGVSETLVLNQKGANVLNAIKVNKTELGYIESPSNTNYLQELVNSSLSNTEIWESGAISSTNGSLVDSDFNINNYVRTKKYYEVPPNTPLKALFRIENSNQGYSFYDNNGNVLLCGTNPPSEFNITTPNADKVFVKISHRKTHSTATIKLVNPSTAYFKGESPYLSKDTDKFDVLKSELNYNFVNELDKYGLKKIPKQTNVFSNLTGKLLSDIDYWEQGYLNSLGDIDSQGRNYHSKNYERVYEGYEYEFRLYFNNNRRLVIYNKLFLPILIINNPNTSETFNGSVIIPKGGYYVRTSHSVDQSFVSNIYFRNKTDVYIRNTDTTNSNLLEVLQKKSKKRYATPIVSFISDDCYKSNDWFVDVLNEKNVKATFAVITGSYRGIYPPDAPNPAAHYSLQRLKELYALGHDMAGHTVTHQRTAQLTEEEQAYEIGRCKIDLLEFTDRNNVFVAPFGSTSVEMERIIKGYFDCAARTSHTYNSANYTDAVNYSPIDSYRLKRMSFDAEVSDVMIIDKLKEVIDVAYENNGWVIFTIHPQYPEYSASTQNGLARRQELRDLIDYIKSLDIPILTASKAFEIFKNNEEIGNQRLDDEYCVIGMDGNFFNNYL